MIRVPTAGDLARYVGQELSLDTPVVPTASLIARFAEVSGDAQWIHDPGRGERAVVPGNLLVSLVPRCLQRLIEVTGQGCVLTAGYRDVRFREPARAGQPLSFSCVITDVRTRRRGTFVEIATAWTCERSGRTVMTLVVTDCYFGK